MSKPIKKINQSTQGYSPKDKPDILNMAKNSKRRSNLKVVSPRHLIDGVFPTGNNPCIGGSNYLRCFVSLQMKVDKIPYDMQADMRYILYRKYFVVTGMGMSTIWQRDSLENYSFEAINDFIGKTFTFAGYDYIEIKSDSKNEEDLNKIINNSIHENKPILAVYTYNPVDKALSHYNRLWRLFIGYDLNNNTFMFNEDGEVKSLENWYDGLESVIVLTKTGLEKPDIKNVFSKMISDLEEQKINDISYGYTAYKECISSLEDDNYFINVSDEELENYHKSLEAFLWFHAESRGATGEGFNELCKQELSEAKYKEKVSSNGFYGYNGHQTAYIGCAVLQKGATALKEKSVRNILVYAINMLMSNDSKIIKQIKKTFDINTPDVLSPRDLNERSIDYCYHSKDMMMWAEKSLISDSCIEKSESLTAKTILTRCKTSSLHVIDIKMDMKMVDIECEDINNGLSVKGSGSAYDDNGMVETKQMFHLPLKIDACIESKESAFGLHYNTGFVKNWNWQNSPGSILVKDIYVDYVMDFDPEFPSIQAEDINITWILECDYMAVIVNGELVHYSENFPYMHFEIQKAAVGFSAFDNKTVIVKSLEISELV